jgi:hypothetical protein
MCAPHTWPDDAALHEMLRKAAWQLRFDLISQCNRFIPPQGMMQESSVKPFSVFQLTCDAVKNQAESLSLVGDDAMTTLNHVKEDPAASADAPGPHASNACFSVLPAISTVTLLGNHLLLPIDQNDPSSISAAV